VRKFFGLVAVVALMAAAYFYFSDTSRSTSASLSPAIPSEVAIAPSGPTAEPSVSIPQAEPVWIEIDPGVLGKTNLHPGGVYAGATAVEPVDDQPVWWADSELPGTDSPGTTFILGHNYSSSGNIPFAALENVVPGNAILVGTANGVLKYSVEYALKTPKSVFSDPSQLQALKTPVPRRLVLMTCDTENGRDTYDNFVVVAQLSM
jgi:hypothetical protein